MFLRHSYPDRCPCSVIAAPRIAKGFAVHNEFVIITLMMSAGVVGWNIVIGQQLKGAFRLHLGNSFRCKIFEIFTLYRQVQIRGAMSSFFSFLP